MENYSIKKYVVITCKNFGVDSCAFILGLLLKNNRIVVDRYKSGMDFLYKHEERLN